MLSCLSGMWKQCQVKREILCMHSGSKRPRSRLHPATAMTENTPPHPFKTQMKAELLGYSSNRSQAQRMGSCWHPCCSSTVPVQTYNMGSRASKKSSACHKRGFLPWGRKTKTYLVSWLYMFRRPSGKLIHCLATACAGIHCLSNVLMSQELEGDKPSASQHLAACGAVQPL